MTEKVIVLVADRDDPKHGEISVVDNLRKAQDLIETLLQAGYQQERIQVFSGRGLALQVTYRPVVSLDNNGHLPAEALARSAEPHEAQTRPEDVEAGEDDLATTGPLEGPPSETAYSWKPHGAEPTRAEVKDYREAATAYGQGRTWAVGATNSPEPASAHDDDQSKLDRLPIVDGATLARPRLPSIFRSNWLSGSPDERAPPP